MGPSVALPCHLQLFTMQLLQRFKGDTTGPPLQLKPAQHKLGSMAKDIAVVCNREHCASDQLHAAWRRTDDLN